VRQHLLEVPVELLRPLLHEPTPGVAERLLGRQL
jgi:hypothetical protein